MAAPQPKSPRMKRGESSASRDGGKGGRKGSVHSMGRRVSARRNSTIDIRIGNKFRLGARLGGGSFGDIYRGTNVLTGEQVAVKLELNSVKKPQLLPEARLCVLLSKHGPKGTPHNLNADGVATVHWYGVEGDYNVMIMDQLGPSLEDVFQFCGRKLGPGCVSALGRQMLRRIEYMHSKHMVHRDLKPENFLSGVGKRASMVYIIDFGLAKTYRDPKTLEHVPYRHNKSFTGTQRYASVNTHMGIEPSRRDEVEAIAYIMLYLLRGNLPWQGMKDKADKQKEKDKAKYQAAAGPASPGAKRVVKNTNLPPGGDTRSYRIGIKKMNASGGDLAEGLPSQFGTILDYSRSLKFEDKPDYEWCRGLLDEVGKQANGGDEYAEEGWLREVMDKCPAVKEKRDDMQRKRELMQAASVSPQENSTQLLGSSPEPGGKLVAAKSPPDSKKIDFDGARTENSVEEVPQVLSTPSQPLVVAGSPRTGAAELPLAQDSSPSGISAPQDATSSGGGATPGTGMCPIPIDRSASKEGVKDGKE